MNREKKDLIWRRFSLRAYKKEKNQRWRFYGAFSSVSHLLHTEVLVHTNHKTLISENKMPLQQNWFNFS